MYSWRTRALRFIHASVHNRHIKPDGKMVNEVNNPFSTITEAVVYTQGEDESQRVHNDITNIYRSRKKDKWVSTVAVIARYRAKYRVL